MAPASSTPVGPPPTITKVSSAARALRIGLAFRALQGQQNSAPDRGGVFQSLEAGRVRLPFVVAEIGMPCPGGQHQRVVIQRAAVIEHHAAVLRCRLPVTAPSRVVTSLRLRIRWRMGQAISEVASDAVPT